MKNFSILIEGVIDAPGETNADINAGIAKRIQSVTGVAVRAVNNIALDGAQVKSARLVVESRGGDHGPTEVVDLTVKDEPAADTSPQPEGTNSHAEASPAAQGRRGRRQDGAGRVGDRRSK